MKLSLKNIDYRHRIIEDELRELLSVRGAVLIEGLKWCGKTTTGQKCSIDNLSLVDRLTRSRVSAMLDEPEVLFGDKAPFLIDEWQEVPAIWDAIRSNIDTTHAKGKFILTGSISKSRVTEKSHSGTGRISRILMRTMSLYESGESTGEVSLGGLFLGKLNVYGESTLSKTDIARIITRGGWPEALELEAEEANIQAKAYLEDICNSDSRNVDGHRRSPLKMNKLLRSYARNVCTEASNATIENDMGIISATTLRDYLLTLEDLFVIEEMEAWNPKIRSKTAIRTSNVRYFSEPAIAAAALGIDAGGLMKDFETFGFLFENLAVKDLRIYAQANGAKVSHYRDGAGLECDAVVWKQNGEFGLVEIKLGGEQGILEGEEHLLALEKKLDENHAPSFKMILVSTGNAYRLESGILVVPIGCLMP
ncbi:MAG: ATP-binding protein [Spirochaetales bacterium]|nr:ATP-binding protein [Candidatus Physcosoma equi]